MSIMLNPTLHLLHAEERLVGRVVPEDTQLRLAVVEERRHGVDEALVLFAIGVVDSVVVLCHIGDNVKNALLLRRG